MLWGEKSTAVQPNELSILGFRNFCSVHMCGVRVLSSVFASVLGTKPLHSLPLTVAVNTIRCLFDPVLVSLQAQRGPAASAEVALDENEALLYARNFHDKDKTFSYGSRSRMSLAPHDPECPEL